MLTIGGVAGYSVSFGFASHGVQHCGGIGEQIWRMDVDRLLEDPFNNKHVLVTMELAAVQDVALDSSVIRMTLDHILCMELRKPRKWLPCLAR